MRKLIESTQRSTDVIIRHCVTLPWHDKLKGRAAGDQGSWQLATMPHPHLVGPVRIGISGACVIL